MRTTDAPSSHRDRSLSPHLPPGQRATAAFPRFGASTRSLPEIPPMPVLRVTGEVEAPCEIAFDELDALERHTRTRDLHCVTTWSQRDLEWSGWRLRDLFEELIVPRCRPSADVRYLVLFSHDGYCCNLDLEDALDDEVLVADTLDGEPLSAVHGAPLRVVSPRQYAYKSLKHLSGIGLRQQPLPGMPLGLEHRRGRVALEERNARFPTWLVKLPYRALIPATAYLLRRGLTSSHFVGLPTLLDDVMPTWDVHELHDLWLDAPPETVYRALSETTPREVRLLGPLMALRQLPSLLRGRRRSGDRSGTLFEELERGGFVRLGEQPGREIVFGVAGRFWKLAGNAPSPEVRDRESFVAFDRPEFALAAMSFLARREGRGTRLLTETRVRATDAQAARKMRRYWRVVQPGSGAIRRSWLAAVRRRLGAGEAAA